MFIEFDLAGAEWVVVAYISGDPRMIEVVESGESPHVATGMLISRAPRELIIKEHELLGSTTDADELLEVRRRDIPELLDGDYFIPRTMTIRQASKRGNHGLNYDMRYRRFALENEMPENDAKPIVDFYRNRAYPGLVEWHTEIRDQIRKTRTLVNLMGRKVILQDQFGPDLWNMAYSFIPQSTVADIILTSMVSAYFDERPLFKPMRLCANVHDSILLQYPPEPVDRLAEFIEATKEKMRPELFARGRTFRIGVDVKLGHNWGTMEKFTGPQKFHGKMMQRSEQVPVALHHSN
jgi:DNA polymerase family A